MRAGTSLNDKRQSQMAFEKEMNARRTREQREMQCQSGQDEVHPQWRHAALQSAMPHP
jgi:hypothetical protein